MQAGFRLVAIVLALALAGGAQACLAFCATPGKSLPAAAATPQKPPCHHCPDKSPSKPTSEPAGPCKHCPTASQDRVASETDHTLLKAAFNLSLLPQPDLAAPVQPIDRAGDVTPPRVYGPPGALLHQFCLLLI